MNGAPHTTPSSSLMDARCEECELEAARMAYAADLGASEWAAFIDRVPPCDGCRRVAVLLGRPVPVESLLDADDD